MFSDTERPVGFRATGGETVDEFLGDNLEGGIESIIIAEHFKHLALYSNGTLEQAACVIQPGSLVTTSKSESEGWRVRCNQPTK